MTSDTYNPPRLCLENIIHYASLYSRDCWKAIGGYRKEMDQGYEDWDFWLSLVEHGYRWECIEEPLMYYRIRTNSMLSRANDQRSTIYRALVSKHARLCQQEMGQILALTSDMQAARDREIATKHECILQLTEERSSLNRQIETSLADIASLWHQLEASLVEIASLRHQLETSQADIASLRHQLETSQAETAFLRQEHSTACAAYEAIRTSRTWRHEYRHF